MKWIDVGDELPRCGEDVLIWHRGRPRLATHIEVLCGFKNWKLFDGTFVEATRWCRWTAPEATRWATLDANLRKVECCHNCARKALMLNPDAYTSYISCNKLNAPVRSDHICDFYKKGGRL